MTARRPTAVESSLVLAVLASGQFVMTLDASVMNVSMAAVAADVGTPITGIQTAITLYTLVMATLMITGGKLGTIMGRRRAFAVGLVVYGVGSLTTAVAPNLAVLLIGWSLLEGVGAALIMPAIVALVATNFPPERRTYAYGVVASSGAIAVAVGPLIGGAVTTFASWRYVFVGEVVLVGLILLVLRKVEDVPASRIPLDLVGAALSVVALGMVVFGVLRSAEWGWVVPTRGGPEVLGTSPVVWLVGGGLLVLHGFLRWQQHLADRGGEPLLPPDLLRNAQLTGGLGVFFAQFLVQAGIFFTLPLFLTVVLGLTPLETGLRIVPLSVALLVAAAGIPRVAPRANPRRVVRLGLGAIAAGTVLLVGGMDPGADAGVVAVPMVLIGLGLGALASQLGAVTVSAVPDDRSADVGGLQNTVTNLGASLGTALVGSVLIATLTASAVAGLQADPDVPDDLAERAGVELAAGIPFLSDPDLDEALAAAGVTGSAADAIRDVNAGARLDGLRVAFAVTGLLVVGALFLTGRLPTAPVGGTDPPHGSAASGPPTGAGAGTSP